MAKEDGKIRVAVNGYGVIGKRVADGIARQNDMELVGVADIETDWRVRVAQQKGELRSRGRRPAPVHVLVGRAEDPGAGVQEDPGTGRSDDDETGGVATETGVLAAGGGNRAAHSVGMHHRSGHQIALSAPA